MKKVAAFILSIAVAITLPISLEKIPTLQSGTGENGFEVVAEQVKKNNTGSRGGNSGSATLEKSEEIPVLLETATAAAIMYLLHIPSLNCFAPDNFEFQCLEEDEDPEPGEAVNDDNPIAAMTAEEFNTILHTEFAELHVTGSGLDFQPKIDGIVGIDFILATNPEPVTHHTQLFDIPITIRATPVHYLWDMGNEDTVSTTDPGKGYPNQTVTYLYEEAGTYTVTLTTTWAGHFTANNPNNPDAPWYPIAGTITTTETSEPIPHIVYKTKLIHPDYQGANN